MQEPDSRRAYWLYLPSGYDPSLVWPMVVSLHGMKPFDHAESQELEWEAMADRYRMIVLAPDLANSDLAMQYPLKDINHSVRYDEQVVHKMITYVIAQCNVDPDKIYVTSWSSGGYLLHYLVVNNPDLFAAVCARGSCFSKEAVESVPKKKINRLVERNIPIYIYYGGNDLAGVQRESQEAVRWYRSLGLTVKSGIVEGRGHERVPDYAADFFAKNGAKARPVQSVEITASYERGVAPFWINLTAKMPGVDIRDYTYYKFSWYINGKLQGNESTWFGTLYKPGENTIKLVVEGPDNRKFEATKTVLVLERKPGIIEGSR
jgi:poly(3-hydroxybutyrate) depolymerase